MGVNQRIVPFIQTCDVIIQFSQLKIQGKFCISDTPYTLNFNAALLFSLTESILFQHCETPIITSQRNNTITIILKQPKRRLTNIQLNFIKKAYPAFYSKRDLIVLHLMTNVNPFEFRAIRVLIIIYTTNQNLNTHTRVYKSIQYIDWAAKF